MVDFQSRDTGRDRSTDDEEDAEQTESEAGDTGTESDAGEASKEMADGETDATADAEESGSSDQEPESLADVTPDGTETEPENEAGDAEYVEITAEQDRGTRGGDEVANSREHGRDTRGHGHGSHEHGPAVETLGVALITVSSSRTMEDDPSGDEIRDRIGAEDHEIVERDLVADDLDGVQRAVLAVTDREDVDVVITTGGTGVTPDDVTIESVQPLFDKKLPGFGELFRILSYEQVGTRALGTRATAGISEGVPVFCLPGSQNAVRLGTEELILPEMGHLVGLANRDN